jgi:replicative superfamily II helicase
VIEQVLALVNGGYGNSTEAVQAVLQSSLAARQGLMPKGYELMALVERLLQGRMLSQDAGTLTATALGHACSGQYLMPATGLRWAISLEQVAAAGEQPAFLDWLALVSLSPDLKLLGDSGLFEDGVSLWLSAQTASVRLHCQDDPDRLQRLYAHAGVLRAFTQSQGNVASVLDWAEGAGLRLYPADLQASIENAGRLVDALVKVARALEHPGSTAQFALTFAIGKLQVLKQMLTTRLDGDLVGLTLLDGIGPKRAQALSAVGLSTLADVASADSERVSSIKGISAERALKLIEQANALQSQVNQEWFRDAGDGLVAPICRGV